MPNIPEYCDGCCQERPCICDKAEEEAGLWEIDNPKDKCLCCGTVLDGMETGMYVLMVDADPVAYFCKECRDKSKMTCLFQKRKVYPKFSFDIPEEHECADCPQED